MKNILLLNGGKRFAHSDGRLNQTLHETALAHLDRRGFDLRQTFIDGGYDIPTEVDKFLWADVVIYQMPGWWMGAPWTVKRYIDEVFTAGHGSLYASDGRTRSDSTQKYGSGGLVQGKRYMISATWNAPRQAFDDSSDFFEGKAWMRCISLPQGQPVPRHVRPADVPRGGCDEAPGRPGYRRCLPGAPGQGVRARRLSSTAGLVSLRWMEWRVEIQALGTRPNGHGSAIRAFLGHDPRVIRNSIFPSIRRIRFHRGRAGKDALHEYSNGRIVK